MRTKKLISLFLLGGALLTAALLSRRFYSHSAFSDSSSPFKGYNLLFISLDTLRADRLGIYGYERDTTPVLDQFARKAVVFEDVISVSSWTLPTHVSFFTGLFPGVHGVNVPKRVRVNSETPLLAEILRDQGYRTYAFTGGGYVGSKFGFQRGFEYYGEYLGWKHRERYDLPRSLPDLKRVVARLKPQERFFIFLHTFDIHCPYNSPDPFMYMFNSEGAEPIDPRKCGDFYNKHQLSPGQVSYLSDRYDGGIRSVDAQLKELFDFLEERDLINNTVIIITSDHGEEFYEHGRIGHKQSLHKELLNVPLIFYLPGIEPGRISVQVSVVDIFATILEILDIKAGPANNGFSLWPLIINGREDLYPRKFQFSELDSKVVLRSHIDKIGHLISNPETEDVMYFDRVEDPATQHEISSSRPDQVQRRLAEIDLLERSLVKQETETFELHSEEELEQLRSLGYL